MKDHCYLIIDSKRIIAMSKKPPKLEGNQRAVLIQIEADKQLFNYTIAKQIKLTENDVMEPALDVQVKHSFNRL